MSGNKKSNRPAPAYQEYASDILASRSYRAMTLEERGLWDTIRKECWVNSSVPSSKPELAKYLGLPHDKVNNLLTSNLMKWFSVSENDLTCPELDAYKQVLETRRQSLSEGGRNGGKKTQENKRRTYEASLQASVKPLSRDETSRDETRREGSPSKDILSNEQKEWLKGYGDGKPPHMNEYRKQTRGY